jgi:uncharacterized DUF497 family protein
MLGQTPQNHDTGESGILFIPLRFDFDAGKSARNKTKHGIDFVEAQTLWDDPDRLEVTARSDVEPRSIVIGRIDETIWAACVTYRHEEAIRIISVRRARTREKQEYGRGSSWNERDSS